jgi:hypothetical protein
MKNVHWKLKPQQQYYIEGPIFWDITPCSPLKVSRRFGGNISRQQREPLFCLLPASCWFLTWLILWHWRGRRHVSAKRQSTSNGLHGVICHKVGLFITTGVTTSSPIFLYDLELFFQCLFLISRLNSIKCLITENIIVLVTNNYIRATVIVIV